ncbi:MAG: hypothetical protein O2930_01340 [Acidobacteria bacterium]|nr:hypothetical protein [Acidobacteriota bacterium]
MTTAQPRRSQPAQLCLLAILASVPVAALEVSSHRLVNRQAVLSASTTDLEAFFRDTLELSLGSETFLTPLDGPPRRVREWIELGGELEDEGWPLLPKTGRYYNHFHDPLQRWDSAGLTFLGPNESSARWIQNRDQSSVGAAGGNWSWHDARDTYYQALTEPNSPQREALLANTFRALGQIMHTVVDASVPEHARNDEHPLGSVPFFWSYDTWVQSGHAGGNDPEPFIGRFLSHPIGPDPSILRIPIPVSEPANAPIGRLIDADMYDGSNPSVTFNAASPSAPAAIGLAEIANANFFSEDTLSGPYPFPRPDTDGLVRTELATPRRTPDGRKIVRRYWTRPEGQGLLPANPVRAECAGDLNPRSRPSRPYPCVDGVVWDQVAAHMLPRAVGYARAVLDYFFRASMRVHALGYDDKGAFIRIENLTDETMEGAFEIYARPKAGSPGEGRELSGMVNAGSVTTLEARATVTLPVTLLPGEHPTASQILVFRGRLGLETESVAAQVFEVPQVFVAQTAGTTTMSEACQGIDFLSTEKGYECEWRASTFEATGALLTDVSVPVIEQVSAVWERSTATRAAQLELDGVAIPGGVWRRRAEEPDPRQFSVRSSQIFGNRLVLRIRLASGDTYTTPLAVLSMASARSRTSYTKPISHRETGPWWVAAVRNASALVFVHPPFQALSISGRPNPTSVVNDPFGIAALRDSVQVNNESRGASYGQTWVDAAIITTTPPPGGPIVLQPILQQQFDAMPVSPLPVVAMESEVTRVIEPVEREFLRTFVTADDLSQPFTIVGLRPGEEP